MAQFPWAILQTVVLQLSVHRQYQQHGIPLSSYLGRLSLSFLPNEFLHPRLRTEVEWTRRDSNPHLHFDRELCYPLHHGPKGIVRSGPSIHKVIHHTLIVRCAKLG
jgi:hypothetical protein